MMSPISLSISRPLSINSTAGLREVGPPSFAFTLCWLPHAHDDAFSVSLVATF